MTDDKAPNDNEDRSGKSKHPYLRGLKSGGGGGHSGRPTRFGSGDDAGDEEFYERIMKALKKLERQTGHVPTLADLSAESQIPITKVKEILWKFLSDNTNEGSTEFSSSLKDRLGLDSFLDLTSLHQWAQDMSERGRTAEPISLILTRLGLANEDEVKNALESRYGLNYLPFSKMEPPTAEYIHLLPEEFMWQHKLVPVAKDGTQVTITMVNPNDLVALNELKGRLREMQVKLSVCTEEDFQSYMHAFYPSPCRTKVRTISWERNKLPQSWGWAFK